MPEITTDAPSAGEQPRVEVSKLITPELIELAKVLAPDISKAVAAGQRNALGVTIGALAVVLVIAGGAIWALALKGQPHEIVTVVSLAVGVATGFAAGKASN